MLIGILENRKDLFYTLTWKIDCFCKLRINYVQVVLD